MFANAFNASKANAQQAMGATKASPMAAPVGKPQFDVGFNANALANKALTQDTVNFSGSCCG